MQRTWRLGTVTLTCVMAAGIGVYAQNTASSGTEQQRSITLTGCLRPNGSAPGTVGTAGTASRGSTDASRASSTNESNATFVLANARVGASPGGGSAVSSPTPPGSGTTESAARAGSTAPSPAISGGAPRGTGDSGSAAASSTYILRGTTPDLRLHVGQQVEVSGQVASSSSAATGATSGTANSSSSNGSANASGASGTTSMAGAQEIEVRTVRMIASVCAEP
jgi:hypothetical protein